MTDREKIDVLIKKKYRNDHLDRYLYLYKQINGFIEEKATLYEGLKNLIDPDGNKSDVQTFCYERRDIPDCRITIEVKGNEVLLALRDYYVKEILALTENDN
jgi:hypothetical protein